jgi:hypothetical protein
MSTNPNYRKHLSSWGPVVVVLLTLGGITLLIFDSCTLSSETITSQEMTGGIILLVLGTMCLLIFVVLLFAKRRFLFPPEEKGSSAISSSKQKTYNTIFGAIVTNNLTVPHLRSVQVSVAPWACRVDVCCLGFFKRHI